MSYFETKVIGHGGAREKGSGTIGDWMKDRDAQTDETYEGYLP